MLKYAPDIQFALMIVRVFYNRVGVRQAALE